MLRFYGWIWWRPRLYRWARSTTSAVLCGAALYGAITALSPWSPLETLKHFAAFRNCDAAWAVGLAPALKGRPGYWLTHDRDNDGIACEPYRR